MSKYHSNLSAIKLNKIEYCWAIHNYSFHDAMLEKLRSPIFTAGINNKCQWYLLLKPNGEISKKNFVKLGVTLHHNSECIDVFARFGVFILNNQKKKIYAARSDEVRKFGPVKNSWAFNEFISRNELFSGKFLPNDKLTIYIEIHFSDMKNPADNSNRSISQQSDYRALKDDFNEDFNWLYENQDFTDVVISVNGKNFQAHKIILTARSPVFAAMFKSEHCDRVEITDIDEKTIEEMLRYMYTGKFQNLDSLAGSLLGAADKCAMEGMKAKCEAALARNLSVENAADTLAAADLYRADQLKYQTIAFIVENSDEIMDSKSWYKITRSSPDLANEVLSKILTRVQNQKYGPNQNQNHKINLNRRLIPDWLSKKCAFQFGTKPSEKRLTFSFNFSRIFQYFKIIIPCTR